MTSRLLAKNPTAAPPPKTPFPFAAGTSSLFDATTGLGGWADEIKAGGWAPAAGAPPGGGVPQPGADPPGTAAPPRPPRPPRPPKFRGAGGGSFDGFGPLNATGKP